MKALDFLQGLLKQNPGNRLTIAQCFDHPLLNDNILSENIKTLEIDEHNPLPSFIPKLLICYNKLYYIYIDLKQWKIKTGL